MNPNCSPGVLLNLSRLFHGAGGIVGGCALILACGSEAEPGGDRPQGPDSPGEDEDPTARTQEWLRPWDAYGPATWVDDELFAWNEGRPVLFDAEGGRRELERPVPEAVGADFAVWTGTEVLVRVPGQQSWALLRWSSGDETWSEATSHGRPLALSADSLLWTGTELIVWGGTRGSIPETPPPISGSAYDPIGDTWRPLAREGAPEPRGWHEVAWTGTEMIVWGGSASPTPWASPMAGGGAYDPATDSWRGVDGSGLSPRYGHALVFTREEILVWGGHTGALAPVIPISDGAAWSPLTSQWTLLPESPLEYRGSHAAAWTLRGMFIWGGQADTQHPYFDGALYDPALRMWAAVPDEDHSGQELPALFQPRAASNGSRVAVWDQGQVSIEDEYREHGYILVFKSGAPEGYLPPEATYAPRGPGASRDSGIGAACESYRDCSTPRTPSCLDSLETLSISPPAQMPQPVPQMDPEEDLRLPGGYCSVEHCLTNEDCGAGADCVRGSGIEPDSICLRTCSADVPCERSNHACQAFREEMFCLPTSIGEGDCTASEADGVPCAAGDPQACKRPCGPEGVGQATLTCQAGSYQTGGCVFPADTDYSCYSLPESVDTGACPQDAAPRDAQPCDAPECTVCNLDGIYSDSSGAPEDGFCVCQARDASDARTWSCAQTSAWPCPFSEGC